MTHIDRYILARWTYGLGEPIISDAEYNNLDRYIKSTGELKEYVNRTWSEDPCPVELLKENNLEHLIFHFNVEKTESIESITSWTDVENIYRNMVDKHYVSFKHDGFNIQVHYMNGILVKAHSRGRATDSTSFTTILKYLPKTINRKEHVCVVGELTLSDLGLSILQKRHPEKDLKTTRGSVRTALVTEEDAELLHFTAFDILDEDDMDVIIPTLQEWKFNTPVFQPVFSYDELVETVKKMSELKESYEKDFPTDAVVVRNAKQRHLRALRIENWTEPIFKTFVVSYVEEHTDYYIPMKLGVYPVQTGGRTHTVVPITNLARVIENGLVIGSPIAFTIKSDATAIIDEFTTMLLQKTYPDYEAYRAMIVRSHE